MTSFATLMEYQDAFAFNPRTRSYESRTSRVPSVARRNELTPVVQTSGWEATADEYDCWHEIFVCQRSGKWHVQIRFFSDRAGETNNLAHYSVDDSFAIQPVLDRYNPVADLQPSGGARIAAIRRQFELQVIEVTSIVELPPYAE